MSTKKTDPHSDNRNSETRGHFLCGKLHHVAEETNVPQFRTQLGDGICQDAKLLETGERGFGTLAPTARACLVERARDVLAFVERQRSVAPAAKKVNGAIRGDSHEPDAEFVGLHFRSSKLVEFGEGLQQRLLTNVFGVRGASREATSQSLKPWSMGGDQGAESLVVAGASCGQRGQYAVSFALQ